VKNRSKKKVKSAEKDHFIKSNKKRKRKKKRKKKKEKEEKNTAQAKPSQHHQGLLFSTSQTPQRRPEVAQRRHREKKTLSVSQRRKKSSDRKTERGDQRNTAITEASEDPLLFRCLSSLALLPLSRSSLVSSYTLSSPCLSTESLKYHFISSLLYFYKLSLHSTDAGNNQSLTANVHNRKCQRQKR
jgi:hypothetical protein